MIIFYLLNLAIVVQGMFPPSSPKPAYPRSLYRKEINALQKYLIEDNRELKSFLRKNETKRFYYLLQQDARYLTVIVTPCQSTVNWSICFLDTNSTGKVQKGGPTIWESKGKEQQGFSVLEARKGLYIVDVQTLDNDSFVSIYASYKYPSGRLAYHEMILSATIRVNNYLRKGQVALHWDSTPIDPGNMTYWISVTPGINGPLTLCDAKQLAKIIKSPKDETSSLHYIDSFTGSPTLQEVGSLTWSILQNLKPSINYSVDVFAVNKHTNLSFLYGNTTVKWERPKPVSLKDSRATSFDIRTTGGRVAFRYRVKSDTRGFPLEWYIMPCGGAWVEAEVRLKKAVIVPKRKVQSLAKLSVPYPKIGGRYTLKISVPDPEMLALIPSLEILGTVHGLPLPLLPQETKIHEYRSLKKCRSITVGWLPIINNSRTYKSLLTTYCVRAREISVHSNPRTVTDHCYLDHTFNSLDYTSLQCRDVQSTFNSSVITQEVNNLRPGRMYEIQVTVKQPNTRILSYDLLFTQTRSNCPK